MERFIIYGVLSIRTVSWSIFWSKRGGIGPLPSVSSVICYVARTLYRTPLSRTGCAATPPHFRKYCPKPSTSEDIGTITEPKTPTSRRVNGSGACAVSNHQSKLKDFFPFTARSVLISDLDVTDSVQAVTVRYASNDFTSGIPPCRPVRSKCHSDSPSCAGRTPLIHYLDYFRALTCQYPYDGITWQDQKNTVAGDDFRSRPGMAVVSKTPSGKYFMTYELCTAGTPKCPVMYRTSDDGWNFGSPSDLATRVPGHFLMQ
jgi:hypothetical protein